MKVNNLIATYRKHQHEKDGRHQTAEDNEVEEYKDRKDQGSSPHGQNEDYGNAIYSSVG